MTRVLNLIIHGVGEPPRTLPPAEAELWVSAVRLGSVLDAVCGRDDVRLSVDDGNASDVEHVLPALVSRDLRATFFVVAGTLGKPGYVTREDVAALAAAGMPIGLHGMRHRPWRRLSAAELGEEHREARAIVEEAAGMRVEEAACPFGAYDRRALRSLRRSGYLRVFTSDGGLASPEAWLQGRTSIRADDDATSVARIHAREGAPAAAIRRAVKTAAKRWR